MPRRRRESETFNLSFLDVMSCGFGAIILIFLLIDHSRHEEREELKNSQESLIFDLKKMVATIAKEIEIFEMQLEQLKESAVEQAEQLLALLKTIQQTKGELKKNLNTQTETEMQISELETKISQVVSKPVPSINQKISKKFSGLNLKGRRLLILFDRSASMLDENLVGIIIRRNGTEESQRAAPKWQRALRILDWLETQLAAETHFQIYTFNNEAGAPLIEHANKWLPFDQGELFREITEEIRTLVPSEGTNLLNAFQKIRALQPPPDNLLLITDSLPTQGLQALPGKVSGERRVIYFHQAVRLLPKTIPVNIILLPMAGDPMAAPQFWGLAVASQGSFITPSPDWP